MLEIQGNNIKVDEDGRFSLTDLWKLSGGRHSKSPSYFLKHSGKPLLDYLKAEMSAFKPVNAKSGRYGGGTYVCKELVYSYAMWISPEFQVKVIRAFDQLAQGNLNDAYETATGRELTTIQVQANNYKLRDSLLLSSLAPQEKLNELCKIEGSDKEIGSTHGAALAARRGEKAKFKEVEKLIIEELQLEIKL